MNAPYWFMQQLRHRKPVTTFLTDKEVIKKTQQNRPIQHPNLKQTKLTHVDQSNETPTSQSKITYLYY